MLQALIQAHINKCTLTDSLKQRNSAIRMLEKEKKEQEKRLDAILHKRSRSKVLPASVFSKRLKVIYQKLPLEECKKKEVAEELEETKSKIQEIQKQFIFPVMTSPKV